MLYQYKNLKSTINIIYAYEILNLRSNCVAHNQIFYFPINTLKQKVYGCYQCSMNYLNRSQWL